jgi:hypothetical protein
VNERERLQELLGSDYAVGGTRKLHVRGPAGRTVGTYDRHAGRVSGFAEVKFYGFERTPLGELRTMGEEMVRQRLSAIETRGLQVDFDAGTVDPLGLSELTNRGEDGPDFLYVVDLRKEVDGVEQAADALGELAEDSWRFDVHEDQ